MKIHLKKLADIQTGYPFRGAVTPGMDNEGAAVIQLSDLRNSFVPDLDRVSWVKIDKIRPNQLIRPDDIIFRSRGKSPVGYWLKSPPACCVAAAPLLRIRLKSNVLHPGYLTWYLRQSESQSYFDLNSQGSSLQMIGKEVLENLQVPVVPMDVQIKIVEVAALAEREIELTRRLLELKEVYVNQILNNRIGE